MSEAKDPDHADNNGDDTDEAEQGESEPTVEDMDKQMDKNALKQRPHYKNPGGYS